MGIDQQISNVKNDDDLGPNEQTWFKVGLMHTKFHKMLCQVFEYILRGLLQSILDTDHF